MFTLTLSKVARGCECLYIEKSFFMIDVCIIYVSRRVLSFV